MRATLAAPETDFIQETQSAVIEQIVKKRTQIKKVKKSDYELYNDMGDRQQLDVSYSNVLEKDRASGWLEERQRKAALHQAMNATDDEDRHVFVFEYSSIKIPKGDASYAEIISSPESPSKKK